MKAELTWPEVSQAAFVGVMRQINRLRGTHGDGSGPRSDRDWGIQVETAVAELAVAKALNLFWSGPLGITIHDVGGCVHVRPDSDDTGYLVVRKGDPDDHVFVLVTGACPSYTVVGWAFGTEGKQEEYWNPMAPEGAVFCVPADKLHDPNQLLSLRVFDVLAMQF